MGVCVCVCKRGDSSKISYAQICTHPLENCRHYKFQINGEIPRDLAIIILTAVVSCFIYIIQQGLGWSDPIHSVGLKSPTNVHMMCTHESPRKWKIPMNKKKGETNMHVQRWHRQHRLYCRPPNYRTTPVNNLFIDDIVVHTNEYVTK